MLLSAEHISLNFGLKQLLDDLTLCLNEGDKIGIIGINGTGKSSFLRVLAGQQGAVVGVGRRLLLDLVHLGARLARAPMRPALRGLRLLQSASRLG